MNTNAIPVEVVRFLLSYDRATGRLTWNVHVGGSSRPGKPAGCLTKHSKGYVVVSLFGHEYLAHRIAWVIVKGAWPNHEVDHKNGIVTDNKWSNLRKATPSQQRVNTKLYSNNTSGFRGVYFSRRTAKWCASIAINRRSRHLGSFETARAASAAYERAARKIHGTFRRAS